MFTAAESTASATTLGGCRAPASRPPSAGIAVAAASHSREPLAASESARFGVGCPDQRLKIAGRRAKRASVVPRLRLRRPVGEHGDRDREPRLDGPPGQGRDPHGAP
jgi:hypothetical protein